MSRWRLAVDGSLDAIFAEVGGFLLGSPRSMLIFQRLCVLETCVSGVCLFGILLLFALFQGHEDLSALGHALLLLVIAVPAAVTAVRLPTALRLDRRCRSLVRSFEAQHQPVGQGMLRLQESWDTRCMQASFCLIALLHLVSLSWNFWLPPCNRYADTLKIWELPAGAIPCEVWCSVCTIQMGAEMACCVCSAVVAPIALERFGRRFTPPGGGGIPRSLLDFLPCYAFGSEPGPTVVGRCQQDPSCAICLEDFVAGERIRRLPCAHEFHAACLDDWLTSQASCPMRCAGNLREAALASGREAADAEAEEDQRAPRSSVAV